MSDNFAALDAFNLLHHGDARERDLWPIVATALSNYELFWRNLIVLLSNRIEPSVSVSDPKWIQARVTIPSEYEQLAMHNYSMFYFAARARQAIGEDRQRVASRNYPHPEIVFFYLQASVEKTKRLQPCAEKILDRLGVGWTPPNQFEDLCQIRLYRDAFAHDPVLGRTIEQGRELLPRLRKTGEKSKRREKFLLWRETAAIPAGDWIDEFELEERLWQDFSAFLQDQWRSLTEAFVQARQCPEFIADLRLGHLLPPRCTTLNTLWSNSRSETTSGSWVFPTRSDATSL
jgi:uncharacterized protein YbdZ (MbtH family)